MAIDTVRAEPMAGQPHRRPSGEPPPLPRTVTASTRVYVGLGAAVVVLWLALATDTGARAVTAIDLAVVRALERARWDPLVELADAVVVRDTSASFRLLAWVVLLVLLVSRRFQHLFAALTLLLVLPVAAAAVRDALGRPRPAGVEIVGRWQGFAHPARPVGELALVATLAVALLVPPGRWRRVAASVAAGALGATVVARLYVGVDHPTDAAAALVLGVAVPIAALRLLTPEEAFPVTYRRGVRAHLDVGGRRGEAIRRAFANQLGVTVTGVQPFALAGSAGSTPLRVTTTDGDLFAKLYAASHLRSDRWYKLGRTVRYGRLEDERPFNSVRRLVQYEDHMLRVLRDAGIPTATPLGIVEITPEREYVLVTELIGDASAITDAELTDALVDEALRIVRLLWDAGLAHRDIKPANVLVAGGRVWLIDVAFAEVRPTPWRQAVDLANMMLTLALCVPPERVVERALLLFTPEEIAEAFAATRAVTVPAQLRAHLRACDDDLVARFRSLAPPRQPIKIQRWTLRRLGLTAAVAMGALVGIGLVVANLELAGLL